MTVITELALASPSVFTGFEQTRVIDLITVLAFASLVIWGIILLSIMIRHAAIIGATMTLRHRMRRQTNRRHAGTGDGA